MTNSAGDGDITATFVDWDLAAATAQRLAGAGPSATASEARTAVDDLRRFSGEAEQYVRNVTGLDGSHETSPVVIVDRGGWARANASSMRDIVAPLAAKLNSNRTPGLFDQIGPKVTALETGALLAFLSSKVLGQFDPFYDGAHGTASEATDELEAANGRLLLVAPNVVHVEREIDVVPRDFRLWVCLHEETHRVQFTAIPWLRDHLKAEIQAFVDATDVDAGVLADRLRDAVRTLVETARSGGTKSVLDLVQSPAQREVVERVTALMSLLEGHADVVMDAVGPDVVPSVEIIRRRFQKRRRGASGLDRTARRMLGLDAKMRQYKDGARFVNAVIDQVGMDGLNRVWEAPASLPSKAEIADPDAWIRRVRPGSPSAPEATPESPPKSASAGT